MVASGSRKVDPLLVSSARRAALDPGGHHCFAVRIKAGQGFQSRNGLLCENILVIVFEIASDFQLSSTMNSYLSADTRARLATLFVGNGAVRKKNAVTQDKSARTALP